MTVEFEAVLSSSRQWRDGDGDRELRVHPDWLLGRLSGSLSDALATCRLCPEVSKAAVIPTSSFHSASLLLPLPVSPMPGFGRSSAW